MNRLELVYLPPAGIQRAGTFDFRARTLASGSPDPAPVDAAGSETHAVHIQPPRLLGAGEDAVVIRGHRNIELALRSGLKSIPVLVHPSDTPAPTVIEIALSGAAGKVSGIEHIIALVKIIAFANGDTREIEFPLPAPLDGRIPRRACPPLERFLGRKLSPRFVTRLSEALTWPVDDLRRLHTLSFSYAQIASLVDLTDPERRCVLRIREAAPLTTGELRNLTRLLVLARGRKHFDLAAWLDGELGGRGAHVPAAGVLKSLAGAIHPRLAAAEASLAGMIHRMGLSNRMRITPPENLEGDSFSCYFRFSDHRELRDHVAKLDRIVKDGSAKRMFEMLDPVKGTERDD
ncbi:MAG: hypothetical protein P8181_06625 [bacterium]